MAASERSKPPSGPYASERPEGPADTLRGFLKRGEAFIEEILRENETLRLRIVQLESKLQDAQTPVPAPVAADELRNIFEQLRREHEELRRRLDEVAEETEQYKTRYYQIEEENDRLVNLFVSEHQLHSTLDYAELVQIMLEILLNFVGAGRFALYLMDEPTGQYQALQAYGLPLADVPALSPGDALVAQVLARRAPVLQDVEAGTWDVQRPRVCVPLKLAQGVVGLITIFSYLEQKEGLSPIDQELFALLADHGGVALESARLAASAPPVTSRFATGRTLYPGGEGNHA